jgi:hypothetical protein
MNPKETFKTPEERGKSVMVMLDGVKADIQAGMIKDWGNCIDGSGGYSIYEVPSEADVFASLHRWIPHVDFDVRQVLTVEQLIEARKGVAPQTGKQA